MRLIEKERKKEKKKCSEAKRAQCLTLFLLNIYTILFAINLTGDLANYIFRSCEIIIAAAIKSVGCFTVYSRPLTINAVNVTLLR